MLVSEDELSQQCLHSILKDGATTNWVEHDEAKGDVEWLVVDGDYGHE